jgi:predicted secreted protein
MFVTEKQKPFAVILVLAVFLTVSTALYAGDVASFVDLGFSENGSIYMFAQYGVDERTLNPWTELYIVDVDKNDFVAGGRLSYKHNKPVALGQDGSAALFRVLSHNAEVIKKYRTSFMHQGVPLFISLEDIRSPKGQTIDFRDFERRVYYSAMLNSITYGSGNDIRSSFFIILNSTDNNGVKKSYRVGNPDVKRRNVTTYSIKKAIVNPDRSSMILVIEMTLLNGNGSDIRYMVEALRL